MEDNDIVEESSGDGEQDAAITPAAQDRYVQELAGRIRFAIQESGGMAAVAKRAGIPHRTLSNLARGQDAKGTQLLAIADATSVDIEWLISGRGSARTGPEALQPKVWLQGSFATQTVARQDNSGESDLDGYALLPRYNVEVSAGEGALATSEQIVEFLAFNKGWLHDTFHRSPEQLMLVQVRGDSMEPTLRDRDLVIVDVSTRGIANGAIHVIRVGEELLVKRLERRLDGSVVVHSDNRRYQPETIRGSDLRDLSLVGQVLWAGGPPRSLPDLRGN